MMQSNYYKHLKISLIRFMSLAPFYTPWKQQKSSHKTSGFLSFQGVQKETIGMKWVENKLVLL